MAVTLTYGKGECVTTATTCQLLTIPANARQVAMTAPAGIDLYVVEDGSTADGAAAPSEYFRIPGGTGYVYDLTGQNVLVAASGVGVATLRAT
jgi:hypothetical protein